MSLSLDSSLSLYSIPLAWLTAFVPMNMKFALIEKTIGYNNLQPRSNTARMLEDASVPRDIALKAERLEGAHLNGNEVLPLWIAAVLSGNFAGVKAKTLNVAAAGFLASRIFYNYIYIAQKTGGVSWVRSAVFFVSIGWPMYLIVKAGNILRSGGL